MLKTYSAPYEAIDEISCELLEVMGDLTVDEGIMATALTMGRLLHGTESVLDPKVEQEFVSGVLEWASLFLVAPEGGVN